MTNEAKPVILTIKARLDDMTKMQVRIAQFVLKNPQKVIKLSISDFAAETGAKSESAIVRFYRVLGFSGYHEFKVSLATEIAGKSFYHTYSELTRGDSVHDVKEKIYNGIIKTLHENYTLLDDGLLEECAKLISESKRIFFIGYGMSNILCEKASFKFMRLGYECYHSSDNHRNFIHLAEPREGDLLFCISFSGISKDVVALAENCKPEAKVIAMTESKKTPLGRLADLCFEIQTEELNFHTDVMMARHAQSMIIDMLYIIVTIQSGESARDKLAKSRRALSYLKF